MPSSAPLLLLFSLVAVLLGGAASDLISSSTELQRVFRLEQDLVQTLQAQKEQLEKTLESIRYATEVGPELDFQKLKSTKNNTPSINILFDGGYLITIIDKPLDNVSVRRYLIEAITYKIIF